jgi:hypothetical protein
VTNDINKERILEGALAIISLSLHEEDRVWKGFDWDILDDMHKKGWISDPVTKTKSVCLSDEGAKLAQEYLENYFGE